ncbi:hypothetical protein Ahy_A06g026761 [Arachis hypogaea]|uniref:Disease resistance N-terminal domain-containing protein n=1 Tax=Arachis hypogaea TaxID=3818 RepID=A0A445CLJ7_ARAHY|nr:hypothetical protein Ahy_A06g026761 [Arachis hypogaea]
MAESFIFSIAESLITKLASRAYQEASRVVGVYDDLQDLKSSLSYVKAVLLDAEQKQEHNHELREWLKQIKLIFYDAENVLDQVDCQALRKQVIRDYGTPKDKVGRFFSSSNPLVFRYKLAHQIKDIRKRIDRVAADRDKFGLQVIHVDRRVVHSREMTYSHVVESDDISENVLHLSFVENGLPCNSIKPSLQGCYELEVLPEWLSNLSSLKFLCMAGCPNLVSLPSDIHRLTSLQVLRIVNCTKLYGKYEPQVGECWPMISHIKQTDIWK